MSSRFRIATSPLDRPFDKKEDKVPPRFFYFISVEGDDTENDYLKWLKAHLLKKWGSLPFDLKILTPSHSGLSSPEQVFELLEQCAGVRSQKMSIKQLTSAFRRKYRHIERYFGPVVRVSQSELEEFKSDLSSLAIRYDVVNAYHIYGKSSRNQNPTDIFGMIIDRDRLSHTNRESLVDIYKACQKQGYQFFLSNPCFELWLYLHVCDVFTKNATEQQKMLRNETDKTGHTYLACLVKGKCSHGKKITEPVFQRFYGDRLEKAIVNAKKLTTTMPMLLDKLGTNVGELVLDMLSRKPSNK